MRVLAVALLLLAACGSDDGGTVTVFAAASLTEAFTQLAEQYDGDVELSFAASSALVDQVQEGAEADVIATASGSTMDDLVASGDVDAPQVFARNRLTIAVPPDNPAGITSLDDLADPDVTLALCAPEVPCGSFAAQMFEEQGLDVQADTEEEDVKAVLDKVATGEVDAGIVYVTDVVGAGGDVEQVDIPDDRNVIATYPIAALGDDGDAFVELVLSAEGQAVLAEAGFLPPG